MLPTDAVKLNKRITYLTSLYGGNTLPKCYNNL